MTEINIICIVVLVGSCSFKVRLLLFGYIEVIYTVIKMKCKTIEKELVQKLTRDVTYCGRKSKQD